MVSLVVGTLLTVINHAAKFIEWDLAASLAWQIPLNYVVPFGVATASALLNARTGSRPKK